MYLSFEIECETWRQSRCTRIHNMHSKESRMVNGWCKNILMTDKILSIKETSMIFHI